MPLSQQPHPLLIHHAPVGTAVPTTPAVATPAAPTASHQRRAAARSRTMEGFTPSGSGSGPYSRGAAAGAASVCDGGGEQSGPGHGRDGRPGGSVTGKLPLRTPTGGGKEVCQA